MPKVVARFRRHHYARLPVSKSNEAVCAFDTATFTWVTLVTPLAAIKYQSVCCTFVVQMISIWKFDLNVAEMARQFFKVLLPLFIRAFISLSSTTCRCIFALCGGSALILHVTASRSMSSSECRVVKRMFNSVAKRLIFRGAIVRHPWSTFAFSN